MATNCDISLLNNSAGTLSDDVLNNSINCVLGSSEMDVIKTMNIMNQQILPAYSDKTNTMLLMNSSYNSSSYVKDDLTSKHVEVEKQNEKARNNVAKVRFSYMQKKRATAYYKFLSGVMQSLIVIVALSAVLASMYKLKQVTVGWLSAGIMTMVCLLLIVVAIIVKNNLTRRPDDWNKFYFAPSNPIAA